MPLAAPVTIALRSTAPAYVAGVRARVDPEAAGRGLIAVIDVRIASPTDAKRFERLLRAQETVTDAAHVTGRFDYQVRAACRDAVELDALIQALKTNGGVIETDTRIALRTVLRRPGPLPSGNGTRPRPGR